VIGRILCELPLNKPRRAAPKPGKASAASPGSCFLAASSPRPPSKTCTSPRVTPSSESPPPPGPRRFTNIRRRSFAHIRGPSRIGQETFTQTTPLGRLPGARSNRIPPQELSRSSPPSRSCQSGPRRQGFASPRPFGAPLTPPGRFGASSSKGKTARFGLGANVTTAGGKIAVRYAKIFSVSRHTFRECPALPMIPSGSRYRMTSVIRVPPPCPSKRRVCCQNWYGPSNCTSTRQ
jgi:hypothetical protein